jgi:hypothetical protein
MHSVALTSNPRGDPGVAVRSKQEILDVLRSAGMYHLVEGRESELPAMIDTDTDLGVLDRLGIYRGDLMDALGASP